MSKFLSGRQSNLKLGVSGYTENKTVLETTGRVGIGTTDAESFSLYVVGPTNITGDTTVGSAITMYASTGIVSATAFYGDGSNLENTGATLSAAAGTQRLVVTSLTSGTMVDAATDSDLTYNATTDTLNVENIDVDGHTELDQLRVTGVSTFAGNVDISSNGNLTVAGNLIVQGTETRLNTTVLEVEDINIGIASVTPTLSDAALDGAGITIHGSQGDKTLTWSNANSRMEFNTDVNVSNLRFDDNQKATFGTSNDLQIYHSGTASFITNIGTGNLRIRNNVDDGDVVLQSDDGSGGIADYFRADGSTGESLLYYYGSQKLATKSDGIDVTGHTETDTLRVSGVSTFQDNVHLPDGVTLNIGTDNDLKISYNGSSSRLIDTSGLLVYRSASHKFRNQGGIEDLAAFNANGSVDLYYDNSLKFQTTGIGVSIYNDLNVGTGVTIYGNAGIVSAISFYGDGSNLTNTGATLSATSGVERLVTTQLTSGTMVDAATDADLTFNAGNNTLNTQNIHISGGISTNGSAYGQDGQLLQSTGTGWQWRTVPGLYSVNNILNGFNVLEEGSTVGTAGSIHTLDFRGINVTATADPAPNGIATVTFSSTPTFDQLTVNDFVYVGSGITMYGATGIVSANKLYGDGSDLTGINAGAILGSSSGTQRLVMTGITSGAMLNAATDADLTFNATDNLLSVPNFEINGGTVSAGGTTGTDGQYLESTGVGVTWKSFPSLRTTQSFSASAGQTIFPFNYNVNFLDVFVNGVKLSTSEYVGTSGTSVVLNTPAFADEIVELHSYNTTSNYSTGPVSVLDDLTDVTIGTLADDQLIQYNIHSGQWENVSASVIVGAASSFATKVATATTATAGQTTFNGTYTIGFVDVFLNGVKQSEDQYTATTGTNIVFNEGASEDDIVEVVGLTANIPAPGSGSYLNSDVDNHLNVGTASTGQILSWNGSDYAWVADQSGGSSYTNSDVDSHINVSGATSGQILSWNGSDYAWVADQSGGGSIAGIDTTATSYFNNIDASGTITANSFSGITTSMISDYGNGLSGGGGSGGISLTDLSVTTAGTPLQLGALAYNNSNGVFTFTPPDIEGQSRQALSVGTANNPLQIGAISYDNGTGVLTYTPPDLSSYQQKTGDGSSLTGIVTSIVAGTNVTVTNSGGTYTINSSGGGGGGSTGPDPVMMGMIF